MKTRTVEYFRLWDNHTWDTDFIDIPADTPEERLENAVREAAGNIRWESDIPVIVGLYNEGDEEDCADLTDDQRNAVANAMGYLPGEDAILNAIAAHEGIDTEALRAALHAKETAFQSQGGRGVDLAEEIDTLRIALALRADSAEDN